MDIDCPQSLKGHVAALPPVALGLEVNPVVDAKVTAEAPDLPDEDQPIAGMVCVIDYAGQSRFITCQRFSTIGQHGYIGAYCHNANGYRQFRLDRITSVHDAETGEQIAADGDFFRRFSVDGHRDKAATRAPASGRQREPDYTVTIDLSELLAREMTSGRNELPVSSPVPSREKALTWGLTPSRRYTLVCGLNVLAFMSRCDGHWHPLEAEVIERFVCSLWLQREWAGDAPLADIMVHAERLSPDWEIVCRALKHYSKSTPSMRALGQAVNDLISADGVICDAEYEWAQELIHQLITHEGGAIGP